MDMDMSHGSGLGLTVQNSGVYATLLNGGGFPGDPKDPAYAEGEAAANAVRYPEFWNPELRAYVYLDEFLRAFPNWQNRLIEAIELKNPRKENLYLKLQKEKGAQLREILEVSDERDKRYAEIIDQHGAEGVIKYWLRMLHITPGNAPATHQLVRIARRLGEHVVMCLKEHYHVARPSHVCPAIMPMVDVPLHPSFPSGHALQSRLISLCLSITGRVRNQPALLFRLSDRVAENRVIAGLHHPLDNEAGVAAAEACFELLNDGTRCPMFKELVQDAENESKRQLESRAERRRRDGYQS